MIMKAVLERGQLFYEEIKVKRVKNKIDSSLSKAVDFW